MNLLPVSRTVALLVMALLLSACAGKGLRGHEPFVTLNNLSLEGQEIELDLGLRNVNALPIKLAQIEFSLNVNETPLAVYSAASQASISANGTENLRFRIPSTEDGRAALESLDQGQINNISYLLEGEITDQEGIKMNLFRDGYLYRVPGRPGRFR
ncbi:MAG: hypothetical protein HKO64_01035 [Xanthomonadales bacterium]|nr:hypothetical protein [Xanthomonadales bacterium]